MILRSFLLLALLITTLDAAAQTAEERKQKIQELEKKAPSKETKERKERTMKRLEAEGVHVPALLPVIDDASEAKLRTKEEIAHRAIAACIAAVKGEGIEQATIDSLVKKFGADKFFSPAEAAFIKDPAAGQQARVQFCWRYECVWVMLWSLGYVDKLDRPGAVCDVPKLVSFFRDRDTAQFIKDAKLRTPAEILDQTDLIYRCHWAATDARVTGGKAPAGLDGEVIQEWHYALNWIVGYMNQDWDDVSTDT